MLCLKHREWSWGCEQRAVSRKLAQWAHAGHRLLHYRQSPVVGHLGDSTLACDTWGLLPPLAPFFCLPYQAWLWDSCPPHLRAFTRWILPGLGGFPPGPRAAEGRDGEGQGGGEPHFSPLQPRFSLVSGSQHSSGGLQFMILLRMTLNS